MNEDLKTRIDEYMSETEFLDHKNRLLKDNILDRFSQFVESECENMVRYHHLEMETTKEYYEDKLKSLRVEVSLMESPIIPTRHAAPPKVRAKKGKR